MIFGLGIRMKQVVQCVMMISLLLTGCSTETQKNESIQAGKKDSEEWLPTSKKEWLAFSKKSGWLHQYDQEGKKFGEPIAVDFEGDRIPEIVVPYSPLSEGTNIFAGFVVGKFDKDKKEWTVWQDYQSDVAIKAYGLGILTFENNREALVLEELTYGATMITGKASVYLLSPKSEQIVCGISLPADVGEEERAQVKVGDNRLMVQFNNKEVEYKTEGNNLLIGKSRKIILRDWTEYIDEEFKQLLNKGKLKGIPVSLGMSYDEAKAYTGKPIEEGYDEGGLCAFYDNYQFCNDSESEPVILLQYDLLGEGIQFKEVEKVLGTPSESLLDGMTGTYVWVYSLSNGMTLIFSSFSSSPDGLIESVQLYLK
jgi:hypothetical protein